MAQAHWFVKETQTDKFDKHLREKSNTEVLCSYLLVLIEQQWQCLQCVESAGSNLYGVHHSLLCNHLNII